MKKTPTSQAPAQSKPESKPDERALSWAGDEFVGTVGRHTGRLQMRWLRTGNTLTIQTLAYWFTYVRDRDHANINITVKANAGGEYKLNSPDEMQQRGLWITWDTNKTLTVGNSTQFSANIEFIPDTGGIDDRVNVSKTYAI
ncbi:hypothetical protein [Pseudomonas sp. CBZ-4]|uniref:hypothetical protein n=1 Tax=Pseudomonas sp. CBZ-4 TaxID=1163065 RepID=UPI00036B19A0|nr:hypothetical protein [Pseudomonas sp. CBZ-4]